MCGQQGVAVTARRAPPKPLMAEAPGSRRPRYVCSDAFFFCFARERISADQASVCSDHCCRGVCTEDFWYSDEHGWCSTRAGVHACCDLCSEQGASSGQMSSG